MSNPLEESYSKTITESFLNQAESLSLELSQKKLTSGIYLRDGSGGYLSSHFTGHHINDALKNESDHNLQWPDTDIIIDLDTLAVFADKGNLHLKPYHSIEQREPRTFLHFYDGEAAYLLESGWFSLGWYDYSQDDYGKWVTYRDQNGEGVHTECLGGLYDDFFEIGEYKKVAFVLAMLSLQRYFSYKDKVVEMNPPIDLGNFIPAKYSLKHTDGFKSGLILPPSMQR